MISVAAQRSSFANAVDSKERPFGGTTTTQPPSLEKAFSKENEKCKDEKIKSIAFSYLLVREYERTVGDNPSVSAGCPITIGWNYVDCSPMTVDEYEEDRPPRRKGSALVIDKASRNSLLKEWDVTQYQIANAVRSSNRTKNRRRTTVINQEKSPILETTFDRMRRLLAKGILLRGSSSKKANELLKKHEAARRSSSQSLTVPEDISCNESSVLKSDKSSSGVSRTSSFGPLGIVIQVNPDDLTESPLDETESEVSQAADDSVESESSGSGLGDFSLEELLPDDGSTIIDPRDAKLLESIRHEESLRSLVYAED